MNFIQAISKTGFICTFILLVCIKNQALAAFPENFESGGEVWYADNGLWQIGTPSVGPDACHSGSQCAATVLDGNYPPDTDSRLISQTVTLPNIASGEEIHLRYWQWFSYNAGDLGRIEVRIYGEEWNPVSSDITNSSPGWSQGSADITAYAGNKIQIGFYHTADLHSHSVDSGWYIDDISIIDGQGNVMLTTGDSDGDGVPDAIDECPNTLTNSCVDSVGCASTGLYTQEQVDDMVKNILIWGDTDGDGKIGLSEAINALQITSGAKTR